MKYYETEFGIFISTAVPAGAKELTEEQYLQRLEEIRIYAEAHPLIIDEPNEQDMDIDAEEALNIITG